MKTNYRHCIVSLIAILIMCSCKKDGEFLAKPVKAIKPFDIKGYAVGDSLEQYFDGMKIRDYYGRISLGAAVPQLAFENEVTVMQLKKKSTGEVVYEQKFNVKDAKNEVPSFYFDGNKFTNSYQYPQAQGTDYLINFYLDGPKEMAPVDIQIEVLEYYIDNNNNTVIVQTTSFPLVSNLTMGKWTEYLNIQAPPEMTPTQSGTDFYPVVTIKDSKTKKYLVNDDVISSALQIEVPDQWTSQGKTQSIHIQGMIGDNKALYFEVNDLVKFFQ